jgi:hypothetical protein
VGGANVDAQPWYFFAIARVLSSFCTSLIFLSRLDTWAMWFQVSGGERCTLHVNGRHQSRCDGCMQHPPTPSSSNLW